MKYALILTTILSAAALEAAPVVSNVSMTQAANRDVTVTYTLSGAPAVITLDVLTNGVSIGAKNLSELAGDVNRLVETDGAHTITFSADYTWANQDDAARFLHWRFSVDLRAAEADRYERLALLHERGRAPDAGGGKAYL